MATIRATYDIFDRDDITNDEAVGTREKWLRLSLCPREICDQYSRILERDSLSIKKYICLTRLCTKKIDKSTLISIVFELIEESRWCFFYPKEHFDTENNLFPCKFRFIDVCLQHFYGTISVGFYDQFSLIAMYFESLFPEEALFFSIGDEEDFSVLLIGFLEKIEFFIQRSR